MTTAYRLRVQLRGVEVEVEGPDQDYVESQFDALADRYLAGLIAGVPEASAGEDEQLPPPVDSGGKKVSLQEFVKRVHPDKDTEMVLTIAYFGEKHEGLAEMVTRQISERFKVVKYRHSNPADAVMRAKRQAYLMQGSSAKSFIVTSTGEQWVEARLRTTETEQSF